MMASPNFWLNWIVLIYIFTFNYAFGQHTGIFSNLYKKAAKENRPMILVLDNSVSDKEGTSADLDYSIKALAGYTPKKAHYLVADKPPLDSYDEEKISRWPNNLIPYLKQHQHEDRGQYSNSKGYAGSKILNKNRDTHRSKLNSKYRNVRDRRDSQNNRDRKDDRNNLDRRDDNSDRDHGTDRDDRDRIDYRDDRDDKYDSDVQDYRDTYDRRDDRDVNDKLDDWDRRDLDRDYDRRDTDRYYDRGGLIKRDWNVQDKSDFDRNGLVRSNRKRPVRDRHNRNRVVRDRLNRSKNHRNRPDRVRFHQSKNYRDRNDRYSTDRYRPIRNKNFKDGHGQFKNYINNRARVHGDRRGRNRDSLRASIKSPDNREPHEKARDTEKELSLRTSVIKNLLRISNDLNCDAMNECQDHCEVSYNGNDKKIEHCEDKCEDKFECESREEKDSCRDDSCALEDSCGDDDEKCGSEQNPSTRGIKIEKGSNKW